MAQAQTRPLDLSGTYRSVFEVTLSDVAQIAGPFHTFRLANNTVDEVRRRVSRRFPGLNTPGPTAWP